MPFSFQHISLTPICHRILSNVKQLGAHPALPVKEAQDSVPRYPLDVLKLVAIDARDALTVRP